MAKNLNGKKAFILSDQHYSIPGSKEGGVDPKAESCALQALELVKPDIFVNIGDIGEWESASHWQWKRVKRPPLEYQLKELDKEAEVVNAEMDKWDNLLAKVGCKEKHLCIGNHDEWVNHLVIEHPYLKNEYSFDKLMKLKDRKFKWYPYGDYFKLGKLALYHGGHFVGKYHAHRHVMELGHNVIYGHTHDQQTAKIPTLGGFRGAWSIGCISKMDKPFLKGRPTNWSHNFAIVHFLEGGKFNVEMVEILNGVAHVWGKKLKA